MQLLEPVGESLDPLLPYVVARSARPGRSCWVLANMVSGLDGSAAVAGRVGALSHGEDAQLFVELRSVADVVLVGASTVRREQYGPVELSGALREERAAAGRAPEPPLAIVTRSLRLDRSSRVFAARGPSQTIVITCEAAGTDAIAAARLEGPVIVAGVEEVDLERALDELSDLGHEVVLCEGGPTLLGQLVAGGLLDELCLSLSPAMGGDPLPVSVTPPGAPLVGFELRHVGHEAGTLFLRYERSENSVD